VTAGRVTVTVTAGRATAADHVTGIAGACATGILTGAPSAAVRGAAAPPDDA
jgi:hypothetical protein